MSSTDQFGRAMSRPDIHLLLEQKVGDIPNVEAIALFDAKGNLVNFSRFWPIPVLNISHREHFQAFTSDPSLASFVSQPYQNHTVGSWSITLLRRVSGSGGEFLGLIASEISVQFLEDSFRHIRLGQDSVISLIRKDGARLARYPHRDYPDGGPTRGSFKETLTRAESGVIRVKNSKHGIERLVSARSVAHYPLAISVSATVPDALAEWRVQALYIVRGGAALAVVIMAAVLLGARQLSNYERDQKAVVETALENMSQGLCMFNANGRLVLCNERYVQMYGLSPEQAKPGLSIREVLDHRRKTGSFTGDMEQYCSELIAKAVRGETTNQSVETADGRTIHVVTRPMKGGGWVTTHEDITERRRAEDEREHNREMIARLAHYDSLTDLSNRVLFCDQLDQALACLERGNRLAVLYIDLDQFKRVNDTLGHSTGDALLEAVADRLRGCVRGNDLVRRLGGDEFAVLQRSIHDPGDAAALAQRIREVIGAPYDLHGCEVLTDASIGIAMAPNDSMDRDQLLKHADLALYAAKAGGRGAYRFYEPEMSARMKARRELEHDLRSALSGHRFELHYQPIVNLRSNRVTRCEALLRWHDAERGWVAPSQFIPVAEESGLILQLGEWVLRQACQDAARWPKDKRVAVNVSAAQLTGGKLMPIVLSALAESGLPPSRLELEITETVLMQNSEDAISTLHQLRKLGVRIALDDFGIGYSSLSYLRSFPFDSIKIDRSFIEGLSDRDDCAAIVRAVTSLAQSLQMTTTAEGIETEQQRQKIRQLGCTEMQGYLISPPRPADEALELLLTQDRWTATAA